MPAKGPIPEDQQRALIHGYYAATSYMDAQLGRVLDALDACPFADNTVIVLWGDHGWHLGDHGMWCKHTCYEQAARIPVIVAAPGIRGGVKTRAMIETVDIAPTLTELAGLPARKDYDGTSFVKQLRDVDAAGCDSIIHVYPRGGRLGRAIRTPRYRMVEWKKPGADIATAEYELYDYETDPEERKNLASELPKVLSELKAILAKHPEAKPQIRR